MSILLNNFKKKGKMILMEKRGAKVEYKLGSNDIYDGRFKRSHIIGRVINEI